MNPETPQLSPDLASLPLFTQTPKPAQQTAHAPAGAAHLMTGRRGTPQPPVQQAPDPQMPVHSREDVTELEWQTVAELRGVVAAKLADDLRDDVGMDQQAREARAQAHIAEAIDSHVSMTVREAGHEQGWSPAKRSAMAKAIFDDLFRLGRLQPIVDDETVENIDIYGWDNVWVDYADGSRRRHEPVASSDAELLENLSFLASRGGEDGRAWSPSNPILDMDLPGNARLAAVHPPISPRPKAVLRIHRFVDITLDDLVKRQTLTADAAEFLAAAVRSGRSIVVAGYPGAGKTTFVRALTNALDPLEQIVTIEKERELHLDRMGDRHQIVTPLQARPGTGERHADGSRAGEVTLVDLLEESLRLNAQRIIVGEVRGAEIDAMFQAMQAGAGSMSTIHASSPSDTIERMAALALRNLVANADYAYRQIAQHISIIVQLKKVTTPTSHRRIVTHIAEVQPGETSGGILRPTTAHLWEADRRGTLRRAATASPDLIEDLIEAGLDPELARGGGQ